MKGRNTRQCDWQASTSQNTGAAMTEERTEMVPVSGQLTYDGYKYPRVMTEEHILLTESHYK